MKIGYVTHNTIPATSAAALNVHQMCNALASKNDVVAYLPWKFWRQETWGACSGFFDNVSYDESRIFDLPVTHSLFDMLVLERMKRDFVQLVYCRKLSTAMCSVKGGLRTILELHSMYDLKKMKDVAKQVIASPQLEKLVVINGILAKDVIEYLDIQCTQLTKKIVVAHDAVDLKLFEADVTKLGGGFNVGYFGLVDKKKGAAILCEMAELLPDVTFHLVGKVTPTFERELLNKSYSNLVVHGFQKHSDAIVLMKAMDALVLPNPPAMTLSKGDDIGKYTSPMKLFEYMATGNPIIASRVAAIMEVLTDKTSLIVEYDDVQAWVDAVQKFRFGKVYGDRLSKYALADVQNYTFEGRAKFILDGI